MPDRLALFVAATVAAAGGVTVGLFLPRVLTELERARPSRITRQASTYTPWSEARPFRVVGDAGTAHRRSGALTTRKEAT